MRAKEFVTENQKFPPGHQEATPGMRTHPTLDNSSPYHPWRLTAHFLAGADGKNPYEHQPEREGPNGQALITIAYTQEEADMVDQAEKAFGSGASGKLLTPMGSNEMPDTNKQSIVKPFKGYKKK